MWKSLDCLVYTLTHTNVQVIMIVITIFGDSPTVSASARRLCVMPVVYCSPKDYIPLFPQYSAKINSTLTSNQIKITSLYMYTTT